MPVIEYGSNPGEHTGSVLPVVLVEPDELARRALSALLVGHGFQLVEAFDRGLPALEALREQHVGMLVSEISLPDMAFRELADEARRRRAGIRIVAVTGEGDADVLAETLRVGVSALLSKYTHPQALMGRLGMVFAGGLLLDEITSPPLLHWLRRETRGADLVLPAREREVLELILQGHGTRSASKALGLAESTVKSHAAKAAARLGMRSSRQAAIEANRRGLIAGGDAVKESGPCGVDVREPDGLPDRSCQL